MVHASIYRRDLEELNLMLNDLVDDPAAFFEKVGRRMVSSTQKRMRDGIAPANAPLTKAIKQGDKTLRDRGGLMASITYRAQPDHVEWGSPLRYARIQQEGGEITPTKAKHLAIPADKKTRSLMRSYGETPRRCIAGMRAAGYSIWKQGSVLMARKGRRGRPFVLFILKDSVTIPARPYLYIDANDEQVITDLAKQWIQGE